MRDAIAEALNAWFGPEFGHGRAISTQALSIALNTLGAPQRHLPPVIHVAGTNGKGSTCAFIAAITRAHGKRVHAYTKPHIIETRERIIVADAPVRDDTFLGALSRVREASADLTHFDAQVAASLLLFSETKADLVVLETGMGGRDDATNVIEAPAACAVTPIALDHVDALGPTLSDIAAHKAGVIKAGAPVAVARQCAEADAIIAARAEALNAPLLRAGAEWDAYAAQGRLIVQTQDRLFDLPPPRLPGAHQIDNAGLALATLDAAQVFPLDDAACARGIETAFLPGRLQRLRSEAFDARAIELWVDGGHNAHGAAALAAWLDGMRARAPLPTIALIGMLNRKDVERFVDEIARHVDGVMATPLSTPSDSAAPQRIADAAIHAGAPAMLADSVKDALAKIKGPARVLACGSFALARDVLAAVG